MSEKRLKRQILKKKLLTKNRLVILNEETFEEIFSLKLNLMNVFVVLTSGAIFLIAITTYIIAFTPLREYIPGYASTKLKREATELALKSDSLEKAIKMNNAYIESIKKVLAGDVEVAKLSKDSIMAAEQADISEIDFKPSKEDAALREKVAQEDKYNLFDKAQAKVNLVLFPPVTGHITDKYDPKTKHFAVDIALPKNTPIKSVANGTVIFADWTPSTGYVIIIRHGEGIMSVYKHAASLTKTQGDIVRTGEVIAMAGSTGQESTGVHLHFELWKDGFAIDPTNFIEFE
ncbi:murein DD-endopeptidase MepM/ murein hydrolase activator NlpD [Flavobacterium gossypii]|uniref:Murein DD-endopeptidase MepM/ murein hydrolase activator NlpD n=2 Tax=Flavobacterium TaxID=237 RepID=A0A495MK89_9FLAO|nr:MULTISPECIES: M23 family metallopeptidase [Flavobacterium]MBA9073356.1 murein DD-endopeptidase MepM/ murein hydrolase activator NlpD [Flavobacterium gossypii]RKS26384.1 murein DD-endopeptidase MepM/ murein hydrolase activator NlpD [Flavobacterium endophyticum]